MREPNDVLVESVERLLTDEAGELRPMNEVYADLLRAAVASQNGNYSLVARETGVGRSTLYRLLGPQYNKVGQKC